MHTLHSDNRLLDPMVNVWQVTAMCCTCLSTDFDIVYVMLSAAGSLLCQCEGCSTAQFKVNSSQL